MNDTNSMPSPFVGPGADSEPRTPAAPAAPVASPFDQAAHELLLRSIDQVATDWVSELQQVRHNTEEIERLVLARAAKVKTDITALYLLGNAARSEANRGEAVNHRLSSEFEKLRDI